MTAGQLQKKSAATEARWAITRKIPVPQFPSVQLTCTLWLIRRLPLPSFKFIENPVCSAKGIIIYFDSSADLRMSRSSRRPEHCVECCYLPARFGASSAIAAAIATAAAIVTKATSASAAAIFAWLRFVDFQGAPTDFLAIELRDR